MNSNNNKGLFRFREYGIDTSTKRKLVDAVKYLQSIGEKVSNYTITRMNEHSKPCGVYKSLECSHPSGLGSWNGSSSNSKALPLSAFKKIYEEFSPIKVGDFVFICFKYSRFMYNGFVEELSDKGDIREVSVYDSKSDTHNFRTLVIDEEIETPHRVSPSNMIEIASKYNKFKNKDKMENRSKKKAFKTGDYISLKLKNGRSVNGFVYRASPLNVAVASGKSFKLHLGVDSDKVSHATIKTTPEFKKRYVSWLNSQDTPIIPATKKKSIDSAKKVKEDVLSEMIGLAKHIREILDRNTEVLKPFIGVPISITIKNINSEEARCLGIVTKINESRSVLEFFTTYTNNDFTERELDVIEIHLLQVVEFATVKEDSAFYEEINNYYTAYLEASDTKLFKLDELNENQYVEISNIEEYKSYCEIANHLGLEWSTGLVYGEPSRTMIELWKKGEKIYMWVKRGCYVDADFIKGKDCELIPLSQIEKPTAIISGNELSDNSGEFKNGEHSVVAEQNPLNQMKNAIGRLKDTIVVPENEPFDKLEEFDPNKPFEVSDDGETWIDDFTHYIGVCPNMNVHFVSKTGRYDSFNFIRNTPMIKVKRSEITGVITKDGTFKNFEIID